MRVPSASWFSLYVRAFGLVIAGMVIGSAVFMVIYQHNFELLYLDNQRLAEENSDLRKTLEPYVKDNRQSVVRQFKLHIYSDWGDKAPDEITTTDLRRKLQNDLESLRGRTFESAADSLLVARGIIHRKIYKLEDNQEFTIELQLVVLKGDTLTIWSNVKPYVRND